MHSASEQNIPRGARAVIRTDIAIELPDGCYGRIAPRSRLASNHGLDVGGTNKDREK